MYTFNAASGTILPGSTWQQVVLKRIQLNIINPAASGVSATCSGAGATTEYKFTTDEPIECTYTFNPGQDVHVFTSATGDDITGVMIEYLRVGDGRQYEEALEVNLSGYARGQAWSDSTVLSGSYAKTY